MKINDEEIIISARKELCDRRAVKNLLVAELLSCKITNLRDIFNNNLAILKWCQKNTHFVTNRYTIE